MAGCKSQETDILLKSQPCETHQVHHGGDKHQEARSWKQYVEIPISTTSPENNEGIPPKIEALHS